MCVNGIVVGNNGCGVAVHDRREHCKDNIGCRLDVGLDSMHCNNGQRRTEKLCKTLYIKQQNLAIIITTLKSDEYHNKDSAKTIPIN